MCSSQTLACAISRDNHANTTEASPSLTIRHLFPRRLQREIAYLLPTAKVDGDPLDVRQSHAGAREPARTRSKFSRICGPRLPRLLTTPWTYKSRPVRSDTSVPSCITPPLSKHRCILGLLPCSVKSSSKWFQALCCSSSVVSLSLSSSEGGGTSFMLVFNIQTRLTVGAVRSTSHPHHPWPFVVGGP